MSPATIVAEKSIPDGSPLYRRGLEQYTEARKAYLAAKDYDENPVVLSDLS